MPFQTRYLRAMVQPLAELEARLVAARQDPQASIALVDALLGLAWALRFTDAERANRLAGEARTLSIAADYHRGRASAARTMAMTIQNMDQLRSIFELAQEAREYFDKADDPAGRAAARDFLSTLHEHVGDLSGGLSLGLEALSIAKEIDDPVRQGYALSSVGGILAASGQLESAVEHLQQGLALFERVDDQMGISTLCSRLASVLKDAERYEEARRYAERCREIAARSADDFLQWSALSALAEIEDKQGNLKQAERIYRAALEVRWSNEAGRSVMGTRTQLALARLLIRRGALDEAETQLNDALPRLQRLAVSILSEAGIHDALADLYERQARPEKALEHLRQAEALRERIARRDAKNKLEQVEVRAAMESAKKEAELQRLRYSELHRMQSKLVEAEKMALLGQLAAGMAHELNSPLGALRSSAELASRAARRLLELIDSHDLGDAQTAKLAEMLRSSQQTTDSALTRIAAVAKNLQRFSQLDHPASRRFDVCDGLAAALDLVALSIPQTVELKRELKPVPLIDGWPRELHHAFLTVLQNAIQAIERQGSVVALTELEQDHVVVTIRDNGRGMSERQVAQLFDVSLSDDRSRTEMRFGLAAAYATVDKHGGRIDVQSALGEGTTVRFFLPVAAASSA
ncbi:MAG: tetratricopeptide repeat protein [Deltaproteobacteria bacterium]|nr:tetratricopeptide repeat protein [Deltaproteobacteria bacterium]